MGEEIRYPALRNLIGSYFHQDWELDYYWDENEPHYAPVVRFFKTHNPLQWVEQAPRDLKEFLALDFDDDRLEDALREYFVLCIRPAYWGLTHREWLKEVLTILEEPMEKTKKAYIPDFRGVAKVFN